MLLYLMHAQKDLEQNNQKDTLGSTKKPPKTDNPDHELTHHQQKHRKLVRQHLFGNPHETVYGLMVSKDDKAYIKLGTSGKCITMTFTVLSIDFKIKGPET